MNFRHRLKAMAPAALLQWAYPRTMRAFCIGTPKSGTTSIAGIFNVNFRADHEPHEREFIAKMREHFRGEVSDDQYVRWLQIRDKRFWLDMEANCFLGHRPDLLRRAFPEAKFLLTVRHPERWLDSVFDNNLNYPATLGPGEAGWHEVLLRPADFSYSAGDEPLRSVGLYPLAAYLTYWSRSNAEALDTSPTEDVLVVETEQIDGRRAQIADFLGIPLESIAQDHGRHNVTTQKHGALATLDPDYVEESIASLCGDELARPRIAEALSR